ncbi:unnamed protein product, partial [Prorocentrum cordatum]
MSGQHAAVRKRALALRAENVATPGERASRAGQRPGGRPTARRPFPADRAALGPSGGRAARRRVHHVLVARRTQLEARLLVRVLGLVVGLLLRNAHAPHPLLPFLP